MTTNKRSKYRQTITLSITFSEPDKPAQEKAGTSCHCKSPGNDNSLRQAGEILLKLLCGEYTPQQAEGVAEVIDALLRRFYERRPD